MESSKVVWKNSWIKSIICRDVTLVLGPITTYILIGSIVIVIGTVIFTELVHGINYFI